MTEVVGNMDREAFFSKRIAISTEDTPYTEKELYEGKSMDHYTVHSIVHVACLFWQQDIKFCSSRIFFIC